MDIQFGGCGLKSMQTLGDKGEGMLVLENAWCQNIKTIKMQEGCKGVEQLDYFEVMLTKKWINEVTFVSNGKLKNIVKKKYFERIS